MGDTNQALGSAGAPIILPVGGKKWKLMPRTKRMEGTFSEWLKAQARADVYATKGELSKTEYTARLNDIADRAIAGHYAFHRQLAQDVYHQPDGLCFMLRLMLEQHQPDVTEEQVADLILNFGEEITAILREVNDVGKSVSSTKTETP